MCAAEQSASRTDSGEMEGGGFRLRAKGYKGTETFGSDTKDLCSTE